VARALALVLAFIPPALSAQGAGGIDRVSWLQGCWQLNSPRRVVEENWTAPRANSMLGVGGTFRNDSLVEYELVVIRQGPNGLTYQAHPSGQPSATFTAQTATDSSVVFENRAHDFPQVVGYRRIRSDSLVAWIEGPMGGQTRRIEFPYARVRCPGN
jgi:uncharacterized protein DUF6265